MGKREQIRQRRLAQRNRQRLIVVGVVSALAVAAAAFLIWQNNRPIGDFVTIEKEDLPFVDGKALGKIDAPVLVQEFSDFQ